MSAGGRLTEQQWWEGRLAGREDELAPLQYLDPIVKHVPPVPGGDLLEIGAAPGRILVQLCRALGTRAHGIDYAEDPATMRAFIERHGVEVGDIHRADFFSWDPGRRYDIVTSFGFIEHFDDPGAVLDRHVALTKPGGWLIVSVPHMRNGQAVLHWLFNREVLRKHNLRCMRPAFFRDWAAGHDLRVAFNDYCGGHYDFLRLEPRSAQLGLPESDPRIKYHPVSGTHLALKKLLGGGQEDGNAILSPWLLFVAQLGVAKPLTPG